MSRDDTTSESRITTDREMIEGWVADHDAIPVRHAGPGDESGRLDIVAQEELTDSHEEITWEEFYDELDRSGYVVLYHGEARETPFEVAHRSDAVGRAALDREELEERLLEGETVTSEITETTVVERTIIEEASIESEVVDGEVVSDEIVAAELVSRDVADCQVTDLEGVETTTDEGPFRAEQFEEGYRSSDRLSVQVDVDETWSLTREVMERLVVESRIVDTDAHEIDSVEAETIESTVGLESIQEALLASGLLESDAEQVESISSHSIESEFREGNVVETRLVERETVDDEVSLRRRYTGEITEGETITADTVHSEVVERSLVESAALEEAGYEESSLLAGSTMAGAAGAGTTMEEETVAGTEETGGMVDAGVEPEAGMGGTGELRVTPTEADEGKHVIDASGDDVGIVVDVMGDTIYVDPHPSITERIKAALDWGELEEDDSYPVDASRIAEITQDRIELAVVEETGEESID